jgi:hypothetical protein
LLLALARLLGFNVEFTSRKLIQMVPLPGVPLVSMTLHYSILNQVIIEQLFPLLTGVVPWRQSLLLFNTMVHGISSLHDLE